ncbi:MAG: nucleotide exchange factor GrpE [Candidatus Gracilibacteria bacterium]|nr:nucleotide exchange factor GrpE [Candidatus Gracilibacteria bacterium]
MTTKDENQNCETPENSDFDSIENEIRDLEENEFNERKEELDMDFSKVTEELNSSKDSLARAQADYQNLLRRVERDKQDMGTYITSNVILRILPFVDNLDRIITGTPEDLQGNSVFEGVKSTYSGIIKTLENLGIRSFDSIGNELDVELHEVMSQLPGKEGIIIQEFEKGYKMGDKVIRHAKVIVGNGQE